MRLKCAGCGKKERVRFATWWYRLVYGGATWIHWPCWKDYEDQRKLDGLDG